MNKNLTDDIYIFLFYDEIEGEINFHIAQSLEDFEEYNKNYEIVSWANITGKNMEISEFHSLKSLKFLKDSKNQDNGTKN
jgi:hypothetical protein